MQTSVMQLILAFLTLASFASLVYCVFYFLFLGLERISQYLALMVGLLFSAPFVFANGSSSGAILIFLPYIIPISLVGGFIHGKLNGHSRLKFYNFALMFLISISGISAFSFLERIQWPIFLVKSSYFLSSYLFHSRLLFTIQLLAPPLLLLLVKNSRLRPGIDKPLSD